MGSPSLEDALHVALTARGQQLVSMYWASPRTVKAVVESKGVYFSVDSTAPPETNPDRIEEAIYEDILNRRFTLAKHNAP
jgi:hypothetical protein